MFHWYLIALVVSRQSLAICMTLNGLPVLFSRCSARVPVCSGPGAHVRSYYDCMMASVLFIKDYSRAAVVMTSSDLAGHVATHSPLATAPAATSRAPEVCLATLKLACTI